MKTKRVYATAEPNDGSRILVDRLWPRGVSKEKAKIDLWLKDFAPSDQLRKWFAHDPKKWNEFKKRYKAELKKHQAELIKIAHQLKRKKSTLVYGAKDEEHNNALVLKEYLEKLS